MTQVSRATWSSDLATKINDNSTGDITPQDLREVFGDLEDSVLWHDEGTSTIDWTNVTGKPTTFTPSSHTHTVSEITDYPWSAGDKTKLDGIEAGAQVNVVDSDPTGVTGADQITNIISLTQAEYDAIGAPDASTLYVITS